MKKNKQRKKQINPQEQKLHWKYQDTLCFPIELKHDNVGSFSGYASVFNNIDNHGDTILKGAFACSIHDKKTFPLLWQHDPNIPIGVVDYIEEDEYGLYIKGRFLPEVDKAKEAYALVKHNSINGLSIGYIPRKTIKTEHGRKIQDLNLLEISLVTFASNEKAKITEVKTLSDILEISCALKSLVENVKSLIKQ